MINQQIPPKAILLNYDNDPQSFQTEDYVNADEYLQIFAKAVRSPCQLRATVVFSDSFVWNSFIVVTRDDCISDNFLQRAMQAEWEFNAGVRPEWWPTGIEADRMWEVHCQEDRHNGRAELARARLDRYDLRPIIRNPLPPRDAA